jgi:signal transduction histidine kinase
MTSSLSSLFGSAGFQPHGYCILWTPGLLWLYAISDLVIAVSYYAIPLALIQFVRKRQDLVFSWVFVMFAAFILSCGTTHVMGLWTLWNPVYWLDGAVKAVTGALSLATALALYPLIPKALALPSPTELRRANEIKSQFLAAMSHELRTPLNSIIGFTELMHDGKVGPVTAEHKEYLSDILTSSRHLLHLINDLLDLSKVEAGKMEFRPEPLSVPSLVSEVRTITSALAAQKRIVVEAEIDPGVGTVTADAARLRQIFYNYLSNALKFSPDGGRVVIRVAPEGETHWRLEVEDRGIGIKPEDMSKLFVEFQQLDGGMTRRHVGSGLGLAVTRQIVEAQGGRVGAHSEPGHGSVFFAVLPRVVGPNA